MEADTLPEKVVLKITAPYHKLLQLEPMHRSQKIIEQKAKEIKIEIQVNINKELCKNILSFGPFCKVLQPQKLKKQIQELIVNMNNLYK
jgi:predicted DNA-binding transcriptional regulator YafY